MIDPLTAAPPALVATVAPAAYRVTEYAAYQTQAEAHAGCIMENLTACVDVIKEITSSPAMLGNPQVMEDLDNRLDFLARNEPDATAALREALAVMGDRPAPEVDQGLVDMLAYIQRHVAPLRDADSLMPLIAPDTGTAMGNVGQIAALDEGGGEGFTLSMPLYAQGTADA